MPDLDTTRCSAAAVFVCKETGKITSISLCETTDEDTASNYRGELIGAIIATLTIRLLSTRTSVSRLPKCEIFCDNMGVVTHGCKQHRNLPESQVQTDLITLLRRNLMAAKCDIQYTHIYGHLDDSNAFQDLTLPQQLNVIADIEAKRSLQAGMDKGITTGPYYPLEPVTIVVQGKKVTSSARQALYQSWGAKTARDLFQRRRIVSTYHFHHIAWRFVSRTMCTFPPSYCMWVTKQVSGFIGTNNQQSRIDGDVEANCPCCCHGCETTSHITRCPNPGRRKLFKKTVDKLLDWMESTHVDLGLVECLETYLLSHGEGSMQAIARPYKHLSDWANELDLLGWDNFLEGRVGLTLFKLQHKSLRERQSCLHIKS